MKIEDLPENMKVYTLYMSNNKEFKVMGDEAQAIMESKNQFFELKSKNFINKNFIVNIIINLEESRNFYFENTTKKLK